MAGSSAIVIRLIGDASDLRRGLQQAESGMDKFKKRVQLAAVGIAAGAAVAGKKAIEIASDTNEAMSKGATVFGEAFTQIDTFAKGSADALGLSKRAALDLTGAMGSILVAQGKTGDEAAKLSLAYTNLAADLGSFNNTSTEEAADALKASITGEFEMLKKYGIVINDARLEQEALNQGVKKTGPTWTAQQKLLLSNSIIMKDTEQAQGDFGRTSDGLANSQKILSARIEDLQGRIGAKLLPIATKVTGAFINLAKWVDENQTKAKILAGVVGGLAGAIVLGAVAIKAWTLAIAVANGAVTAFWAANRALNAVMNANPAVRIALIVGALIAILVTAYKTSETFRRIVQGAFAAVRAAAEAAWSWIRSAWGNIKDTLTGPFNVAKTIIGGYVKGYIAVVTRIKNGIVGVFKGLADVLTAPLRAAIDMFKSVWNSTVGGKGIPSVGIGKFKTPGFTIPMLAEGGTIARRGWTVVGDAGPELLNLGRGAQVVPLDRAGGSGGPDVLELTLDLGRGIQEVVTINLREHDRDLKRTATAGGRRTA